MWHLLPKHFLGLFLHLVWLIRFSLFSISRVCYSLHPLIDKERKMDQIRQLEVSLYFSVLGRVWPNPPTTILYYKNVFEHDNSTTKRAMWMKLGNYHLPQIEYIYKFCTKSFNRQSAFLFVDAITKKRNVLQEWKLVYSFDTKQNNFVQMFD